MMRGDGHQAKGRLSPELLLPPVLSRNFHLWLKSSRNGCSPSTYRAVRSHGARSRPSGGARGILSRNDWRHLKSILRSPRKSDHYPLQVVSG